MRERATTTVIRLPKLKAPNNETEEARERRLMRDMENTSFTTNPPHMPLSYNAWAAAGKEAADSVDPARKQADERAERASKRARRG